VRRDGATNGIDNTAKFDEEAIPSTFNDAAMMKGDGDRFSMVRHSPWRDRGCAPPKSDTLERYAGDGVMVSFNDPVPVPQPALQAVQAALDMRAAIATLTDKWSRLGHDLGFGVGIAHGHATLGTIGFEGRFDYSAIGTVSNVATRLCDEAKPGQILISPRVLMAVEGAVIVEPVGEFELKGIRRPIAAHNVLSAASPSP
jgi:class 3 adenylate cyclase